MPDTEMEEIYNEYLKFTDQMAGKYDAFKVAAVMMTQALSIYRSSMDENQYNQMVDNISASRDKIHIFEKPVIQ
jgi:hypothetical protein